MEDATANPVLQWLAFTVPILGALLANYIHTDRRITTLETKVKAQDHHEKRISKLEEIAGRQDERWQAVARQLQEIKEWLVRR